MLYITAQPATEYSAWQIAVQCENFIELGIIGSYRCLLGTSGDVPEDVLQLVARYSPLGAKFFFYRDTRNRKYLPGIKPYLMAAHYRAFPEMYQTPVFYLDSDVIFREIPQGGLAVPGGWRVSDCRSYMNCEYITSKGAGLLEALTSIVGISASAVKSQNQNAGGAQYVIDQVPEGYWEKVELDSERLYRFMQKSAPVFEYLFRIRTGRGNYLPIQAWCAEMWAMWWNAIYFGIRFDIDSGLNFTWATTPIEKWETCTIFHNAGVTDKVGLDVFNKTKFKHESPLGRGIVSDSRFCGWHYVQLINRTPCLT